MEAYKTIKVGDIMTITCCKDCTKRRINCHSHCERYKKQKDVNEEIRHKRALETEADMVTIKRRKNMGEKIARERQRGVAMR